jgi:hypothetical protein
LIADVEKRVDNLGGNVCGIFCARDEVEGWDQ